MNPGLLTDVAGMWARAPLSEPFSWFQSHEQDEAISYPHKKLVREEKCPRPAFPGRSIEHPEFGRHQCEPMRPQCLASQTAQSSSAVTEGHAVENLMRGRIYLVVLESRKSSAWWPHLTRALVLHKSMAGIKGHMKKPKTRKEWINFHHHLVWRDYTHVHLGRFC